jgi:hypothetical protein
LRPIDWIERPESFGRRGATSVDQIEDSAGIESRKDTPDGGKYRLQDVLSLRRAECRGVLLCHDGIVRERAAEPMGNQRLNGEVGDRDW